MATGTIKNNNWKLVWTNSTPTASQAEQDVSVDLSAYSELLFIFNRNSGAIPSSMNLAWTQYYNINDMSGGAFTATTVVDGSGHLGRRIIQSISSSGFHIQDGRQWNSYGSNTPSTDNSVLILLYVYAK